MGQPGGSPAVDRGHRAGRMVREFEYYGQTRDGQVQITSLSAELIQVAGEACILASHGRDDRRRRRRRSTDHGRSSGPGRAAPVGPGGRAGPHRAGDSRRAGSGLDRPQARPLVAQATAPGSDRSGRAGAVGGGTHRRDHRCRSRIATELRPSVLDHLGLVAAVEWQAQDFEKLTGLASD